jgi:hypothetical protein
MTRTLPSARIAAEAGRRERAGLLWSAVEQEEERGPIGQWEGEREAYAAPVLARADGAFERGRQRARSLSLDEVVDVALSPNERVASDGGSVD